MCANLWPRIRFLRRKILIFGYLYTVIASQKKVSHRFECFHKLFCYLCGEQTRAYTYRHTTNFSLTTDYYGHIRLDQRQKVYDIAENQNRFGRIGFGIEQGVQCFGSYD